MPERPRPSGPCGRADWYHSLASACKANRLGYAASHGDARGRPKRDRNVTEALAEPHRQWRPHQRLLDGPPSSTWHVSRASRTRRSRASSTATPTSSRPRVRACRQPWPSSATWRTSRRERWPAAGPRPSACSRQEIDNPFFSVGHQGRRPGGLRGRLRPAPVHDPQPPRARRPSTWPGSRTAWSTACSSSLPTALPEYVASCAPSATPSCSSTTTARRPAARSSTPPTGAAPGRASPTSSASGHRRIGFITGRPDVGAAARAPGRLSRRAGARPGSAVDERARRARRLPGGARLRGGATSCSRCAGRPRPSSPPATRPPSASSARRATPACACPTTSPCSASTTSWRPPWRRPPALSTVRQPLREMGRVAVQRLMSLLADPSRPADARGHGHRARGAQHDSAAARRARRGSRATRPGGRPRGTARASIHDGSSAR